VAIPGADFTIRGYIQGSNIIVIIILKYSVNDKEEKHQGVRYRNKEN